MKIQVIQREFKSHGSFDKSYKICDCEYCCEGMKQLPDVDFYFEVTENTDNPIGDDYGYDLGIMLEHSVTYHDPWDYDDYGYTQEYYYKLNYCPICGEKIEVEIVDYVDVTNEYEALVKERERVHKKCIKTDSIKKQNEYLKLRQKLDSEMEGFYRADSLPHKYEEDYM